MKVQICSINNKEANYYVDIAKQQGYTVYVDEFNCYCVDVLTDGLAWRK